MFVANLTDGQRVIKVSVATRAELSARFVKAMGGESLGEFLTFESEAEIRQALGTDLTSVEAFERARKFVDGEISIDDFMGGSAL